MSVENKNDLKKETTDYTLEIYTDDGKPILVGTVNGKKLKRIRLVAKSTDGSTEFDTRYCFLNKNKKLFLHNRLNRED